MMVFLMLYFSYKPSLNCFFYLKIDNWKKDINFAFLISFYFYTRKNSQINGSVSVALKKKTKKQNQSVTENFKNLMTIDLLINDEY